jgi:hypothetical protein
MPDAFQEARAGIIREMLDGAQRDVTCEREPGAAPEAKAVNDETPAIRVELTNESVAHCLKIVFQAKNCPEPLEIYLHTTQAIELAHQLHMKICEVHHRDSRLLMAVAAKAAPEAKP